MRLNLVQKLSVFADAVLQNRLRHNRFENVLPVHSLCEVPQMRQTMGAEMWDFSPLASRQAVAEGDYFCTGCRTSHSSGCPKRL